MSACFQSRSSGAPNSLIQRLQRLQRQLGKYSLDSYAGDPASLARLPLMDFGRVLDPACERPLHLKPLVAMLDEATAPRRSQRLYWFSVPIRHWKSTTLRQAAVRHLCRWPDRGVAFCSHTQSFASKQSRQLRKLARAAGIEVSDEAGRQDEWEISGHDGGLVARGVGGELTGRGFRLIVVDDPLKGRELAESAAERDRVWEWLQDDVITRLDPDGALVLVHSRWHPDDPIGRVRRLESRSRDRDADAADEPRPQRWAGVNVPAISEDSKGEERALLPRVWGLDHLREVRESNPAKFSALYQGEPRHRQGVLFSEPTYYDELPTEGYRVGYGVDLAYTARSKADWSVAVRLHVAPRPDARTGRLVPHYFVEQVVRRQCEAPAFCADLERLQRERRGPMVSFIGGTEKGAAQFIRLRVPQLSVRPAVQDKYQRALPASELWNLGRILVPKRAPWLEAFLDEVCTFTGKDDPNDDQVDALAGAVAALRGSSMAEALSSFATRQRETGQGWAPPPAIKVG